jgi:tRNA pseudouridine38-40 synthase
VKARAIVAYDGTRFHGFQRQANARSVQEELERAIARVCGGTAAVAGAGRTDAGVHATGQVVAFEVDWRHPFDALQRALNSALPDDVAVSDVRPAEPDFHPRYSARSRVYEYRIVVGSARLPLIRLYAWQIERPLDLESMRQASRALVGEHDFAAFGTPPRGDGTVRTVMRADWADEGSGFRFTIEANAFLYRMVRRIVATLARVGSGQLAAADVAGLLAGGDPRRVVGAAPARGLCLVQVNY